MTPSYVDTAERACPKRWQGYTQAGYRAPKRSLKYQVPRWFRSPKATPATPTGRGVEGPGVVEDPAHAWKHFVREPGGPVTVHGEMEPWAAMGSPRT